LNSSASPSIVSLKRIVSCLAVFGLIVGFLFSYYHPAYLLLETTTAGGDMCSQYLTAHYFVRTLLPSLKIIGWMPGNYAGFPLFQFYFPFPFLVMAALEWLVPLKIAFKLVSASSPFLLPFCVYACLRHLRFHYGTALIGAAFSLMFLFMEANSMWGGNIPSTLAGEFSYGIGMAFLYLYIGTFHRGLTEGKWVRANAILLALVGFSHGYTILFGVCVTAFLLFTTDRFGRKIWYYLRVNALAFFLLGFWIVQLLWFTPYTTSNNFIWIIKDIWEVFPPILLPAVVLACVGLFLLIARRLCMKWGVPGRLETGWLRGLFQTNDADEATIHAEIYLWVISVAAGVFYLVAHRIGVVDIRFIPFLQLTLVMLGAIGLGKCIRRVRARGMTAVLLAVATLLWVNSQVNYIPNWIQWDYNGFEKKAVWKQFKGVNDHLRGSLQDPRVVYEHNDLTAKAGSLRAFEMLPLFSGRSTLEGLYPQSSPTSPFVFYIQSEISATPSRPLPQYNYSHVRIDRALAHLRLFNVSHIIAVGAKLKKMLGAYPEVVREKEFPPFTIYRYTGNLDRYVSLAEYDPVLMVGGNWKQNAYQWFRKGDLRVPVIFKKRLGPEDKKRFKTIFHDRLPDHFLEERREKKPHSIHDDSRLINESISPEEIVFETPHLGKPHLVRVSYHPNWKVEGAERVYLVSPSFMLVYPKKNRVRLYFSTTFPNHLGQVLTVAGLLMFFITSPFLMRFMRHLFPVPAARVSDNAQQFNRWGESVWSGISKMVPVQKRKPILQATVLLLLGSAVWTIFLVHNRDATIMYRTGMDLVKQERFAAAREVLKTALAEFPGSSVSDETSFFYGITHYKEKNWEAALSVFQKTLIDFPDARNYAEILFHIGKCQFMLHRHQAAAVAFRRVLEEFPDDVWAKYALEWLDSIPERP